jgi:biotin carboxylase
MGLLQARANDMKTVVFIETNFSGLDAIRYCKENGYRAVLVTDSFDRFRRWFPSSVLYKLDLADQVVTVKNSNDIDEVRAALEKQVGTVDAILTFAEIRTLAVAKLCRALGLAGANPAAVEIAQDKHRFRQVLLERGVDTVKSTRVDSVEQLSTLQGQLTFPCFIKPLRGHSSIGSVLCRNASEFSSVTASLGQISEDWISRAFVAEDFLDGDLVSIEILTTGPKKHQVVGVADRDVIKDSIETGSSFPLVNQHREAVVSKACQALDAIGYEFGASHVEMMMTSTGPHLVEVNTRVGGSGHSVMLDLSTGRSIVGDCIELSLGSLVKKEPLYGFEQGAAWKCFVSQKVGTIKSMPSLEEIKGNAGVKEVWFHHETGDELTGLNSNFSWIVQVMCTGKDSHEAKSNAARAIDFVEAQTVIA